MHEPRGREGYIQYSRPLVVDVRLRHRPTKARPNRVAPTSYTVPFSHPRSNPPTHPREQIPNSMAQYDPTFLMIKKRQRKRGTRKHARAVPPCLPSLIRIQSECGGFSGVRRQASGNQGLLFLFDLAGSLALKKIWRINVSEALYGSEACGTMRYGSIYRPDSVAPKSMSEEAKRRQQKKNRDKIFWRTKRTTCY